VLSQQLQKAYPESNKELEAATGPVALVPGPVRKYVAAFTGLLMVVVGMVLLIACANAATLLLAQATARRREMAIRVALGAGRSRLVRQALTESVLLAGLGGILGIVLAEWAVPALMALKPSSLPVRISVPLDWRVLGFALLLSFLTGVIFGIAPALTSTASDPVPALKDEVPASGLRRSMLRNALVVSQVAVCLVLLIGAGLCMRSLIYAQSINPGFDAHHALAGGLNPGSLGYSEARGRAFYDQVLERVTSLPGVRSATFTQYLPLTTTSMTLGISIPGRPSSDEHPEIVNTADVGPGYFQTMGIPVLQGREFTSQDGPAAPHGLVINQALARQYWLGENPLGKTLMMKGPGAEAENQQFEVVGVVATGRYRTLSEPATPFMYRSLLQYYHGNATLVVRAVGEPTPLLAAVRHEVKLIDPDAVLTGLITLQQHMALPLFPARTTGLLLGAFGLLGLLLAVVGLYGVISYAVSQRTREFGIHMAMGAQRGDVLKMVVKQGLFLTVIGTAIGLGGAFAGTRVLASLLYGIHPTDLLTFALVTLTLMGVALLASYIPARRATKVDPMVALRYE
jgi:predicted permease